MASHAELTSYINSLLPIVYWRMDESTGTSFAQTGTSTAGSMSGAGATTAGNATLIPNDTTLFATFGPTGYASASRGNVAVPFGDVTISYLIRFYPPLSSANIFALSLMGLGDSASTTNAQTYQYFTPSNATFNEIMEYGTGANELVTSVNPLDLRFSLVGADNTFMVTTVRNSVSKQLSTYVNGRLFDQQTYANNPTGGTAAGVVFSLSNNTVVGIQAGNNTTTLGHVCMFNRLLTEQEVVGLAQAAGRYDVGAGDFRFASYADPIAADPNCVKTLLCAIDPLIDISVAFPDEAYTYEE